MAAKHARVEVYRSTRAQRITNGYMAIEVPTGARAWRWRFISTNGNILADSAEGYTRRGHCLNGAAVALGLPKSIRSLAPGESKLVRRSGGAVRVVVLDG